MNVKLDSFAKLLIEKKLITESQAFSCLSEATQSKNQFFEMLHAKRWVDDQVLSSTVAEHFKFNHYDWDTFSPQFIPKNIIDEKIVIDNNILPVEETKDEKTGVTILHLVIPYPHKDVMNTISRIRATQRITIETYIGSLDKTQEMIETHFGQFTGSKVSEEDLLRSISSDGGGAIDVPVTKTEDGDASTPIVQYINQLLREAIRMRASDLHFEPFEENYRVRFRVDGVLQLIKSFPPVVSARFISRLKVMSQMDISEKRNAQDGRIRYKLSEKKSIDFRVNSLPTVYGEKMVLRILDPSSAKMGIDALGYEPEQKELFLEALNKPQGMILITGPTGSGKTVSLYTGLNILNTMDRNISTAEDPVEINLNGINQVNVNPKTGLSFATVLRSFLRQDPDVIMVGEIRDLETAEIAIKAAQTGHMVLSTLHTNSAPETLTRLRNMGIPSFNIATSVNLVIAQRLARRLCQRCRKSVEINEKALLDIGFTQEELSHPDFRIYEPVGCNGCTGGYKGRVGIYEVVKINKEIANIIMDDGNAIQIAKAADDAGFPNLRRAGIKKVLSGLTSVQELMRVTDN